MRADHRPQRHRRLSPPWTALWWHACALEQGGLTLLDMPFALLAVPVLLTGWRAGELCAPLRDGDASAA